MCTHKNVDVDCCWPCSAVESGNYDYHCPCFNIPSGVKFKNEWTVTSTPLTHSNQLTNLCYTKPNKLQLKHTISGNADPGGSAVWGVGLGCLYCWDWASGVFVVGQRCVSWADHVAWGVLKNVVCLSMIRWNSNYVLVLLGRWRDVRMRKEGRKCRY